jgi:acyl-CoA dehydrogenase
MSETTDIVVDTTRRIFRDLGDPQTIINAEGRDWAGPLWAALEEAGLTRAWVPEALGGADLSVTDTFALLREAGAHAVAVPLAETLLAAWTLAKAGIAAPDGMLALAVGGGFAIGADGTVTGSAEAVPFARAAGHLVVVGDKGGTPHAALLGRGGVTIAESTGIAGEPRDGVTVSSKALSAAPLTVAPEAVRRLGATVRATQIAGALEALLKMCVDYSMERVAFTRTISKFQAVQHLLARQAEETASAIAAVSSAAYAIERDPELAGDGVMIEVAAAKVRAGEAATEAARIAHQIHGAIGFTAEHPLHRYVLRAWAWRDDCGDETEWAVQLGRHFARGGGRALWPTITAA